MIETMQNFDNLMDLFMDENYLFYLELALGSHNVLFLGKLQITIQTHALYLQELNMDSGY